ncbi:hypothetical protein [Candidatus Enterovibrio escicola]
MSGRQSQQKLFEYLQSCERKGVRFTKQQLIEVGNTYQIAMF